ncbi:efflux RND transporter periplasmic adaptor subunit [Neorhodopirellula pilleata]|uniref:Multidrug resistance protein MdtN n=1 Tax=Neorhodopirellula pilleata TaxID=2714738 RepID=A0A5C5ZI42_9BACT|nr:HlyD family efflux transporter periplasmic adaptor subunit [Neorhodopirellula pilleata]TWT86213.1 multidrug resistance protein MdtN [Neorhodopirellula pilleata]
MIRFLSKTRWLTHHVLPTIILVSSAVAFFAMGSTPEVPRKPKTAIKATVVAVAEIHALDGPLTIETTGEVVPHRVLSIASEVQGRIVFKHPNLRVGEQVRAGETLIKIDPQRFALTVQRLEINVNQAATTLKQLQQDRANLTVQVVLARKSHQILVDDVKRIRGLHESRATSISELGATEKLELDARLVIEQLVGRGRSLEVQIAEQELAGKLAMVQLEEAKIDQVAAEVKVPVSGIVVAAPQEEYAMVQAGDLLLSIEETGCLEVHCHLKLDEMAWVWGSRATAPADSAKKSLDDDKRITPVVADVTYNAAGTSHTLHGRLVRQHGAGLDPATRTIACRVLVDGNQIESAAEYQIPLMTGMFVNVQVKCHPNRPLLQLPEQGIRTDGCVWLMRGGKLCAVPVKTIQSRGGVAIVETELNKIQPRDKVIVSPVANAKDGLAVREQGDRINEAEKVAIDASQPTTVGHAGTVGGASP